MKNVLSSDSNYHGYPYVIFKWSKILQDESVKEIFWFTLKNTGFFSVLQMLYSQTLIDKGQCPRVVARVFYTLIWPFITPTSLGCFAKSKQSFINDMWNQKSPPLCLANVKCSVLFILCHLYLPRWVIKSSFLFVFLLYTNSILITA